MFQQIARGLFGDDEERGDYHCLCCGSGFERRRQICPSCQGFRIERREW